MATKEEFVVPKRFIDYIVDGEEDFYTDKERELLAAWVEEMRLEFGVDEFYPANFEDPFYTSNHEFRADIGPEYCVVLGGA